MTDTPILYPPHVGRIINAYVEAACARAVAVATRTDYNADAHRKASAEFDRLIGQLSDAEDLLTFLDDTFSGGHEIRLRVTPYPYGVRTQREGDATVVWVCEPASVSEFGETDAPLECVSDALRAWRDEPAARARSAREVV